MKKRAAISVMALLLLGLGTLYLFSPPVAPPGQEPLATIHSGDTSEFEDAFDGAADMPRVVLLVSPT